MKSYAYLATADRDRVTLTTELEMFFPFLYNAKHFEKEEEKNIP